MQTSLNILKQAGTVMVFTLLMNYASNAQVKNFPTQEIKDSFLSAFQKAENVSWQKFDPLYLAIFSNKGESWIAYFNTAGEVVTNGRRITRSQLPLVVQSRLKSFIETLEKKHGNLQTGCMFEMVRHHETEYYIPVENENLFLALKSRNNGEIVIAAKKHKAASLEIQKSAMAKK